MKRYRLRSGHRCPTCREVKIIRTGAMRSIAGSATSYELRCARDHCWWDTSPWAALKPKSFDRYLPRKPIKWE